VRGLVALVRFQRCEVALLSKLEIAGAVVRAERGVDLGWLRDVLRAVKAAT